MTDPRTFSCQVEKADTSLGVVFGWAVVSTEKGEEYFDLQSESVPVDVVAKAIADAPGRIVAKVQHSGEQVGEVVFAMPIYEGGELVSKSEKTGLFVGVSFPEDILAKFADGSLTGFSIAGNGEVEDAS